MDFVIKINFRWVNLLTLSLFIIFFLNTNSFAKTPTTRQLSCKTIRLDEHGGPFEKIPLYNQMKYTITREEYERSIKTGDIYNPPNDPDPSLSGLNLCYSIADSELIDAYRFSQGDKLLKLTSPLSLALFHKTNFKKIPRKLVKLLGNGDDWDDMLGPGNPILALVSNKDAKVCDQRWLEKTVSIFSSNNHLEPTGKTIENFLKNSLKQIAQKTQLKEELEEKKIQSTSCAKDINMENFEKINITLCSALSPKQQISDLQIYLSDYCKENSFSLKLPFPSFFEGKDSEADKDIDDKIDAAGSNNFQVMNALVEEREKTRRKPRIKEKISELLSAKDAKPVGIGYCHGIITGVAPKECHSSDHTSVIIGQRWNGKSCEFLVRDSMGEEACKKSSYGCDNGSSWIPETDLIDSTKGVGIYWL